MVLPCIVELKRKSDVIFIMGASSPVSAKENFKMQKEIAKKIIRKYKISGEHTEVGVVLYGRLELEGVPFGAKASKRVLLPAIDRLRNPGDGVRIDLALNFATDTLMYYKEDKVPQYIIAFMDQPADHSFLNKAKMVQGKGIHVTAIGIGNDVNRNELNYLSSDGIGKVVNSPLDIPSIVKEAANGKIKNDSGMFRKFHACILSCIPCLFLY